MSQVISKEFINRLIKDVKYIKKNPLDSNGIYYLHDEENLMTGYALIIGPEDTPYFGGFYFFEFSFTPNYPHEPPIVKYMTNGENIRFNPNFYRNGKVCISLLNTWRGDQWTSCQSISTVLLTLCTLFVKDPLLNEPGIQRKHRDLEPYNKIIEYANYNVAICNVLDLENTIHAPSTQFFKLFHDITRQHFIKHSHQYIEILAHLATKQKEKVEDDPNLCSTEIVKTSLYNMSVHINYQFVKNKMVKLQKLIKT